ncbi:HutD family protein [Agrobacterium sp.]|jgi:environmental stress-induced protein Ves|uniref:HutD/Ves family protein n=1 Tax=Agrobacterium sp. TaxID=361 RepID=UPI0028AC2112
MRLLRASEHKAMPWKNGLGVTHEVALEPSTVDGAQFLWRVSLATIKGSGPFSVFPGIDRSIVALKGNTVRLVIDGHEGAELKALGTPFPFPGEAAVEAINEGGETTDLNIMTLRNHTTHVLERVDLADVKTVTGKHDVSIIVFTEPSQFTVEDRALQADALDALVDIGFDDTVHFSADNTAVAYIIGIDVNQPRST